MNGPGRMGDEPHECSGLRTLGTADIYSSCRQSPQKEALYQHRLVSLCVSLPLLIPLAEDDRPKLWGITFYNNPQAYQLTPSSVTAIPLPHCRSLLLKLAHTSPVTVEWRRQRTGMATAITFVTLSQMCPPPAPCLQGGSQHSGAPWEGARNTHPQDPLRLTESENLGGDLEVEVFTAFWVILKMAA